MARTKTTRSFYLSDESVDRLAVLAERDFNQPSRYLEKLIDQAWTAQMGDTAGGTRRRAGASRPQAAKRGKKP